MGYTNFTNGTLPAMSDETLNNMQIELMKLVFPIGSIYITQDNTNPSEILKFGTWERVKGEVLVGLDENDADFNVIGKTGGEKAHTLTTTEIPSHVHYLAEQISSEGTVTVPAYTGKSNGNVGGAATKVYASTTAPAGGNQPHSNLQPYRVVGYMYLRTA